MNKDKEYTLTWLDRMLMKEEELDEMEVREMQPYDKFKMWLNLNSIYGYEDDIINAINTAYGVDL